MKLPDSDSMHVVVMNRFDECASSTSAIGIIFKRIIVILYT